MDDANEQIVGTGKYYKSENPKTGAVSGKINVNDNVARAMMYENGQDMVIVYNRETRETCMKPLGY